MCNINKPKDFSERQLLSEELRFIYEKHMDLFNVRREHEWKVFFGMITLIGLSSAALLNYDIHLDISQKHLWVIGLIFLFLVHFLYQKGVQRRNRIDRIIMDDTNKHLCTLMGLNGKCLVRINVDAGTKKETIHKEGKASQPWYNTRYIWAFVLQNVTLFIICSVACVVGWGGITTNKDHNNVSAKETNAAVNSTPRVTQGGKIKYRYYNL